MSNFYNINGCMLDKKQIEAIECDNDAVLLVAGAGSGKTLTILGKIKYLIQKKEMKEDEILCISFTNETVKSLISKLDKMNYKVDVLTFHKLGLKILGKMDIISDNYLEYVINEYFKSRIYYDKKLVKLFKNYFYYDGNVDKLLESSEYYKFIKLINTFIKLAKARNMNIYDIYNIYKKRLFNERLLLKYILEIYLIYERELEGMKKIDFDDMIIKAKDNIKNINLQYKYIIIDEFQDTSYVRYLLVNEIIKKNKAKIFAVGDDYQSIYRFSGCNLDLFLNFKRYFRNGKIFYLEYTYRNSNQLIYVSCNFIMKNKKQLRKKIKSYSNLDKPIKIVMNNNVSKVIDSINSKDILVIGRNNSDIKNINYDKKLTIHRSKGLEAEYVILANSDSIPSTIKNDEILRFVLPTKDYILYEEERRLFYVALTRTKSYIYILVNKKISPFVKELIHDYKNYIEIIS